MIIREKCLENYKINLEHYIKQIKSSKGVNKSGWSGNAVATMQIIEAIKTLPLEEVPDNLMEIATIYYDTKGMNYSELSYAYHKSAYSVLETEAMIIRDGTNVNKEIKNMRDLKDLAKSIINEQLAYWVDCSFSHAVSWDMAEDIANAIDYTVIPFDTLYSNSDKLFEEMEKQCYNLGYDETTSPKCIMTDVIQFVLINSFDDGVIKKGAKVE